MGHMFVRVSRGPNWLWQATCHKLVKREEHHHRPDARYRCDTRWINTVSFVRIFWYNLNGFLNVENVQQFYFFPRQKGSRWPPGSGACRVYTNTPKCRAKHLWVHRSRKKYCIFYANNMLIAKFTRPISHTSNTGYRLISSISVIVVFLA